jgi:hypothetical protein
VLEKLEVAVAAAAERGAQMVRKFSPEAWRWLKLRRLAV